MADQITIRAGANGDLSWKVDGLMPLLNLIGYIHKVQGWIEHRKSAILKEDGVMFRLSWDGKEFSYKVANGIVKDAIIGVLEIIKTQFVHSQLAQIDLARMQAMQQQQPLELPPAPRIIEG